MYLSLAGTSAIAIEDVSVSARPEIDFEGEMRFYPFVYTEANDWAWARELIGDCSACIPGYLYLQNLTTKEITQIIDDPVDMFRSDNEVLFCLVNGTSIVQTNYWGKNQALLYTSQYGGLANLEYWEGVLLFSDGNHVIRFDVETGNKKDMGIYEGITAIYMSEAASFTWADTKGTEYVRNADGQDVAVPEVIDGCTENCEVTGMYMEISDLNMVTPYAISAPVTFPLSEYPVGSYFTINEKKCETHDRKTYPDAYKNCKNYRGGIQCEGFGRYVLDRYAHIPLSSGSSWYSSDNLHYHTVDINFSTVDDVRLFFHTSQYAKYGTYLRLSDAHTVIIADISSSSVTLYDANYSTDNHCVVKLTEYTFAKYFSISKFKHITRIVAHSFTSNIEKAGSKYHKAYCSYNNCGGYTFYEHASSAPGKNATCQACGYVGEIWNIVPLLP